MGKPPIPCKRDCPRRKMNCHNAEYCPDWEKFEKDTAAFNEMVHNHKDKIFYSYIGQRGATRRKFRDRRRKNTT